MTRVTGTNRGSLKNSLIAGEQKNNSTYKEIPTIKLKKKTVL